MARLVDLKCNRLPKEIKVKLPSALSGQIMAVKTLKIILLKKLVLNITDPKHFFCELYCPLPFTATNNNLDSGFIF